jgi:CTP synthase (UTP-ammonia lyase)
METFPAAVARVALVGDRSPHVRAHQRIPAVLDALREHDGLIIDAYWVATDDAEHDDAHDDGGSLPGFDGIWVLPGSPYRSMEGALTAVRHAREGQIPYLGSCGGFQHAMLEFARDVAGLPGAGHAEYGAAGEDPLIVPLDCSLVGHELSVRVQAGSLAERILGCDRTVERYHCSYGLNPAYLDLLRAHGMRFTGEAGGGDVRIAELPAHPFFLATLFQPELAPCEPRPHPIIRAFARAAVARASARIGAPAPSDVPAPGNVPASAGAAVGPAGARTASS